MHGDLNIPREEQDALNAIDSDAMDKLIEQCLHEKRPYSLRILRLESCGPFVASNLRAYEDALAAYASAKSAKKIAETECHVSRAGSNLGHAVRQMKHRMQTEQKEGLLFHVDDQIMPPFSFSEHLTVRVRYRWRQTIEDEWVCGSITFSHEVDQRPDYNTLVPKRKPSAGRRERDRKDKLYSEWEHLMKAGLHSVREYFREGGSAASIPQAFRARADPYSRGLNNHSARFWIIQT